MSCRPSRLGESHWSCMHEGVLAHRCGHVKHLHPTRSSAGDDAQRRKRTPAVAGDNGKELAEIDGAAESRSEKPTAGAASIAEAGGSGGQPLAIRRLKPRGATPQAAVEAPKKLNF